MVEVKKPPDKTVETFFGKAEKSSGEGTQIRTKKQETVIQDIDEVMTEEDIPESLDKRTSRLRLQKSAIIILKKAYENMQTVTISSSFQAAFKLEVGIVKINCVVCRPREQVPFKRCLGALNLAKKQPTAPPTVIGYIFKECKADSDCILSQRKRWSTIGTSQAASNAQCLEHPWMQYRNEIDTNQPQPLRDHAGPPLPNNL